MVQNRNSGNRGAASKVERMTPLFNDAFVRIFGSDSSRGITRGLINAILRPAGIEPIGEIQHIDAEHTEFAGSVNCRMGRMDVCVVAEGNRILDLEAQRYNDEIANRSLFYAAHMICENTPENVSFGGLPQAIVITLLDTLPEFPESEDYLWVSRMDWSSSDAAEVGPCTDRMVFVLVELEKVRRRYTNLTDEVLNDETLAWLYLLARGYRNKGETMEIAEKYPTIEEFAKMYGLALDDPKLKQKYRGYNMAVRDEIDQRKWRERVRKEAAEEGRAEGLAEGREEGIAKGMAKGIEKGMAKGIAEGREEERERIIAAMRENGFDEETIGRLFK